MLSDLLIPGEPPYVRISRVEIMGVGSRSFCGVWPFIINECSSCRSRIKVMWESRGKTAWGSASECTGGFGMPCQPDQAKRNLNRMGWGFSHSRLGDNKILLTFIHWINTTKRKKLCGMVSVRGFLTAVMFPISAYFPISYALKQVSHHLNSLPWGSQLPWDKQT